MRKLFLFSVAGALLLSGCGTGLSSKAQPSDPSSFTYTRVYCTPDNESHFENVTIQLIKTNVVPPAPPAYVGGNRPSSSTLFLATDAHWGADDLKNRLNHPAQAAGFLVQLAGIYSVTTTDGDTRRFSPGDVVRFEDTAPCKGHITVVDDKPSFSLIVR